MTVKQLIERLKQCDPDATVFVRHAKRDCETTRIRVTESEDDSRTVLIDAECGKGD